MIISKHLAACNHIIVHIPVHCAHYLNMVCNERILAFFIIIIIIILLLIIHCHHIFNHTLPDTSDYIILWSHLFLNVRSADRLDILVVGHFGVVVCAVPCNRKVAGSNPQKHWLKMYLNMVRVQFYPHKLQHHRSD